MNILDRLNAREEADAIQADPSRATAPNTILLANAVLALDELATAERNLRHADKRLAEAIKAHAASGKGRHPFDDVATAQDERDYAVAALRKAGGIP